MATGRFGAHRIPPIGRLTVTWPADLRRGARVTALEELGARTADLMRLDPDPPRQEAA